MVEGDFPARLLLALKALSLSRGRLASELAVHKSVVSRWLNGRQAPSGENLANLTRLVAAQRPGFTLLDWETDLDTLAARLGVAAEPAPEALGPLASLLPEGVLQEARALTALRGADYEGVWRTTRPAIGQPGRFMHDHVLIRRADNGLLSVRLQVEDMQFVGWTLMTQTQLFSFAADARSGVFIFSIYNAVLRHKAERLDGISLTIQRVGGGSPVAGALLLDRVADLTDDPEADEAGFLARGAASGLAPKGSIPEDVEAHLLRDFGPSALAQGGHALLTMPFATSWSRGPNITTPDAPPSPPRVC